MVLDEIVANKKAELERFPSGRFRKILQSQKPGLVCELKLKSPTHPEPFVADPKKVLDDYQAAGVDAISVVTDNKYFGGSLDMVRQARATGLPVLRKDFILNPRQITEVSTDALLLIARILSATELKHMVGLCLDLGIEPIVEIHGEDELAKALNSGAKVIAVNSRDLQAQNIDLKKSLELMAKIPKDRLRMFFSGIGSADDLRTVSLYRTNGVLIGTSVLTSGNRQQKIKELRSVI